MTLLTSTVLFFSYYGCINFLVTHILQNIFFFVQVKKEIHTGSEQLEGEKMMTEF